MAFITNHFYILKKPFIEEKEVEMVSFPSWTEGFYGTYGIYGSTTSSFYYSNYSNISYGNTYRRTSDNFILGQIYQAASPYILYDKNEGQYTLTQEEVKHFEEVDIGLSPEMKNFMARHYRNGKMSFQITFKYSDVMSVKIYFYGKYFTWVCCVGKKEEINSLMYRAYKELRKCYANKLMTVKAPLFQL